MTIPDGELQGLARAELLSRLTDEELWWLAEPLEQAAALVECPDHPQHDCACPERGLRASEASPGLYDEAGRRWRALCERWEEILAREPKSAGSYRGGVW